MEIVPVGSFQVFKSERSEILKIWWKSRHMDKP